MKRDKKSLVAYSAGLFDGEGCIFCQSYDNKFHTSLHVNMNSKEWADLFVGLYGGQIYWIVPQGGRLSSKPYLSWRLTKAEKVEEVLKTMLPFLRIKKEQAELAIRLCVRKKVGERNHTKWMQLNLAEKKLNPDGNKLSQHEIDARNELVKRIIALKDKPLELPKCILASEMDRINAAVETKQNDRAICILLQKGAKAIVQTQGNEPVDNNI